jgi:putative toxin-antitoxin system antitoxin component (TIGR02293 family)
MNVAKTKKNYRIDHPPGVLELARKAEFWTLDGFRQVENPDLPPQVIGELTFAGQSAGIRVQRPGEVIDLIKQGLPLSSFEKLRKTLGVTSAELGRIVQIPLRTMQRRRKSGKFLPDESERIYRLGCVADKAINVFGNEEGARHWMSQPNKALSRKPPLVYCDTEPGRREVEDLLGRIEHGVFS